MKPSHNTDQDADITMMAVTICNSVSGIGRVVDSKNLGVSLLFIMQTVATYNGALEMSGPKKKKLALVVLSMVLDHRMQVDIRRALMESASTLIDVMFKLDKSKERVLSSSSSSSPSYILPQCCVVS